MQDFLYLQVLLSIAIAWFVCLILTLTDVFPKDSKNYGFFARTDTKYTVIRDTPWIRVPYPGKVDLRIGSFLVCSNLDNGIFTVGPYWKLQFLCTTKATPN